MAATNGDFDFAAPTRLVFGAGRLDELGQLAADLGGRRVLLVTDLGIVRAGHVDRAEESLRACELDVIRFDDVTENPTTDVVEQCAQRARAAEVDLLIGLGGGSSLDTAKGCNFVLSGGGSMEDYWGYGKAKADMLPMIAVPTTAGTGSECQSFALISQPKTHVKMACGDRRALPKVALLDPQLSVTQPHAVTVATGVDALAHALETAVSTRRTVLSQVFSRESFCLCVTGFEGVLAKPDDIEARGQMLLGAALAGSAIENSMLGAAHAAANPLSAHYQMVHGHAVGLMLPAVVRLNAEDTVTSSVYRTLSVASGLVDPHVTTPVACAALVGYLERWLDRTGIPRSLAAAGIERPDIDRLSDEAATQWTAQFNPRPVAASDFAALYRSVLGR
jgi:alcohol dehydrogenase